MKKPELVKKEEIPKLILGGASIYGISWFMLYLTALLLSKVIISLFGSYESYGSILAGGLPDASLLYKQGFLSGVIILVALILLVILVAFDEYYFSRELKGFKRRLFWGISWGLIFVILDTVAGSICFSKELLESGSYLCSTFSIADTMGIFYWLFILLIVVLPFASEHYGRAKASYKKENK